MGAAQQRLLACLVHCLAISALQTQAVLLSRPVFFADIQTAINNVPAGNSALVTVIEIPEGEVVDFGMNSLVINKVGVTLKSAGPGPVTFQSASTLTTTSIPGCADTPSGIPFVQICNGNGPPPAAPITFEGIIFKNTLIWPNNKGNGPNKGIGETQQSRGKLKHAALQRPGFEDSAAAAAPAETAHAPAAVVVHDAALLLHPCV